MEMEEENGYGGKRKPLTIDWLALFGPDGVDDDDPPPELVIAAAKKSKVAVAADEEKRPDKEDLEIRSKSDCELKVFIDRNLKRFPSFSEKLPDKGEKLKANIRRHEEELERREKFRLEKAHAGCEDAIQLSDQSDDGAACGKNKDDQKSSASSKFGECLLKKMDEDKDARIVVNAFEADLSYIKPCQRRKMKQTSQLSSRGRSREGISFRSASFKGPSLLSADSQKQIISNGNSKDSDSATTSRRVVGNKPSSFSETNAPQDPPSRNLRPRHARAFRLVDEEEPPPQNSILYVEKLDDCMKDVKVYYPLRDDPDSVEVLYTDMACLAPEACLSSTIMNFYIRYLQQSTSLSESANCNYHFFNTYFYNKLQKSYKEDSFLKFRKWWKGVNIFEKGYILLPVHENAHWSLVIICFPTKEDELGPCLLHLDSLGIHDSRSIFDNIKSFVKEEWSYLRNAEGPLDLPITEEIWENLDRRMDNKRITVPQQRNDYDCGLFVLFYMERFIEEAPQRLRKQDLSMFSKQWFHPEEASNLRVKIHNLLVEEFQKAKEKESTSSPCD